MPIKDIPQHLYVASAWCAGMLFGGAIANASHPLVVFALGLPCYMYIMYYVRQSQKMEEMFRKTETEQKLSNIDQLLVELETASDRAMRRRGVLKK